MGEPHDTACASGKKESMKEAHTKAAAVGNESMSPSRSPKKKEVAYA